MRKQGFFERNDFLASLPCLTHIVGQTNLVGGHGFGKAVASLSVESLGIEKVVLKMGRMILYFALEDAYFQSRAFEKVLNYVAAHGRGCTLRDGERKSLLIKGISTMEGALSVLEAMEGKGTHSTTTSPNTEKLKAP